MVRRDKRSYILAFRILASLIWKPATVTELCKRLKASHYPVYGYLSMLQSYNLVKTEGFRPTAGREASIWKASQEAIKELTC